MEEKTKEFGDLVKGRCQVCRDVTRHTVLKADAQKPLLVRCNSCEDQHKFKLPPPSKAEKQRAAKARSKAKKLQEDRERWERMRPRMIEATAKEYSMDGLFKKKDVINHPLFGLGMVEKITGPHKVEVLFEDGCRTMRCH